jgi:hypothetical protein
VLEIVRREPFGASFQSFVTLIGGGGVHSDVWGVESNLPLCVLCDSVSFQCIFHEVSGSEPVLEKRGLPPCMIQGC